MRSRNRAGAAIRDPRVDRIRGDWRAASGNEHAAEQRSSPAGAQLKGRRAMAQTILVTGSNSGFGRLMVETLARKGYSVFAGMRDVAGKNAPAAEALRQVAERERLVLHIVKLDVTDDASVEQAVEAILATTGRLDVAVNNAGVSYSGPLEPFTLQQVPHPLDTHLFSALPPNPPPHPTTP